MHNSNNTVNCDGCARTPVNRGGRYIDENFLKADKSVFLKLSATYRFQKMKNLKLSKNYRYRKLHQILADK